MDNFEKIAEKEKENSWEIIFNNLSDEIKSQICQNIYDIYYFNKAADSYEPYVNALNDFISLHQGPDGLHLAVDFEGISEELVQLVKANNFIFDYFTLSQQVIDLTSRIEDIEIKIMATSEECKFLEDRIKEYTLQISETVKELEEMRNESESTGENSEINNLLKQIEDIEQQKITDETRLNEILSLESEKAGLENQKSVAEGLYNDLIFEDEKGEEKETVQKAECFLPYVREMFQKDFSALIQNADVFKSYIQRFLAYYYMFYVSQLAVKLWKFDQGDRNEIEKIYMTLNWEGISKVRPGYEYGWKYVTERLGHMFSHSCVMFLLSHNIEDRHYDYIGLRERFEGTPEDEAAAREIREVCKKYENWIPMDYENCIHKSAGSECKASREAERLFETIDYQFINGGRSSHYNGYNKKFIDFVQKNFGKRRGTLGYTVGVNENDIVMFTRIILLENQGSAR